MTPVTEYAFVDPRLFLVVIAFGLVLALAVWSVDK